MQIGAAGLPARSRAAWIPASSCSKIFAWQARQTLTLASDISRALENRVFRRGMILQRHIGVADRTTEYAVRRLPEGAGSTCSETVSPLGSFRSSPLPRVAAEALLVFFGQRAGRRPGIRASTLRERSLCKNQQPSANAVCASVPAKCFEFAPADRHFTSLRRCSKPTPAPRTRAIRQQVSSPIQNR